MKTSAKTITPKGGQLATSSNRIRVQFQPRAISKSMKVSLNEIEDAPHLASSLTGQVFEIAAEELESGQAVKQFLSPITIQVMYDPDQIRGNESSLTLFAFDEELQDWVPLPTQVDTSAHTMTAQISEPGRLDMGVKEVEDPEKDDEAEDRDEEDEDRDEEDEDREEDEEGEDRKEDWEAVRLPSLAAFQSASFTGAATYSMLLKVPPGPGGLQPSLALTYNSQVLDSAKRWTQAAWVGMGWSLDTGYIQRNMHGTGDNAGDDTFSLIGGGVSTLLLKGEGGYYHTAEETFWRIEHDLDNDTWIVRDKTGTKYVFGHQARYPEIRTEPRKEVSIRTWRWSLTEVHNIFGQVLTCGYATETKKTKPPFGAETYDTDLAVYPAEIRYPHGRYRIVFERIPRQDFKLKWNRESSRILFQKSLLSEVRLEHDADGDNTFEQVIRRYVFTYESDPRKSIFPNVKGISPEKPRTPTLAQVQEFGLDGSALPPFTFHYGDHMHLTRAENGYSGKVEFIYEPEPWHEGKGEEEEDERSESRRLVRRNRVVAKRIFDGTGRDPDVFHYRYDEPATNDAVHSESIQNTTKKQRYNKAYSEFRGHAMVQEIGPDGRVATTWFHQDDGRKGRVHRTMVSTQTFWDSFDELSGEWRYRDEDSGSHAIERVTGDSALRLTSRRNEWGESAVRNVFKLGHDDSLSNTSIVHFRLGKSRKGQAPNARLLIRDRDPDKHWGVVVRGGKDAYQVDAEYDDGSGAVHPKVLIPAGEFKLEAWYALQFTVDDENGFLTRIWQRDNPEVYGEYQHQMPARAKWRFLASPKNGSLWLDSYSEGRIYNEAITFHQTDELPVGELPFVEDGCKDLKMFWTRPIAEQSFVFEGDARYVGRWTEYEYSPEDQGGTQYGNITQVVEKAWDGDSFVPYRAARTQYFPNANTAVHLVGLPAALKRYRCPGGDMDFGDANLLSASLSLYDDHPRYDVPPEKGIPTGKRTLLYFAGPQPGSDPRYADEVYVYDDWGNRKAIRQYKGEGTESALATEGKCVAITEHDPIYHTYPVLSTNCLDQATRREFDYAPGLPIKETDPNLVDTMFRYDGFGRLIELRKPGDEEGLPTVAITYHDREQPFWVEQQQKRGDGEPVFTLRRIYDGAERIIQVQTAGAQIDEGLKDIVTNSFFGAYGRIVRQTVTFALAPWDGHGTPSRGRRRGQPSTRTRYDILGRPLTVWATDDSTQKFEYTERETIAIDPLKRRTRTVRDVWGRTVEVIPTLPPTARYEYDELDRLTKVHKSGNLTRIEYDLAGRKLSMDDPDMGHWEYSYDALGNLVTQMDARKQVLWFGYDEGNRLVEKRLGGPEGALLARTSYDQGPNGKGRRTRMDDGSGYTTWSYDARGRLIREIKAITGGGTFVTHWGHNSADQVLWMKYPGGKDGQEGEQVNFDYLPQNALARVYSDLGTYVESIVYDAAGRVVRQALRQTVSGGAPDDPGAPGEIAPLLQKAYSYYPWGKLRGRGRLQQMRAGKEGELSGVQDLRYIYDEVGNIISIEDWRAGNPQTQAFEYDDLDRLISANVTGGSDGLYSESYEYDEATGNMAAKGGVKYEYRGPQPHAVTHLEGTQKFWYDANGNMDARKSGDQTENLFADAENRQIAVGPEGTAPTFGDVPFNHWAYGYIEAVYQAGYISGDSTDPLLYRPEGILTRAEAAVFVLRGVHGPDYQPPEPAEQIFADVPVDPEHPENNPWYAKWANDLYNQGYTAGCATDPLRFCPEQPHTRAEGTVFFLRMLHGKDYLPEEPREQIFADVPVDSANPANNPWYAKWVHAAYQQGLIPACETAPEKLFCPDQGLTRAMAAYMLVQAKQLAIQPPNVKGISSYDGDGRRARGTGNGKMAVYVGNHYELEGDIIRQYYYAGAQRVAMRENGTLYCLLGDHLGSTAVTADANGSRVAELRYKAFGETRYQWGVTPTTYRYTGQRQESELGLYYYNARWYNPVLGRFTQADTVRPQIGSPQALDRYMYVYGNPLGFIDPSGNIPLIDGQYSIEHVTKRLSKSKPKLRYPDKSGKGPGLKQFSRDAAPQKGMGLDKGIHITKGFKRFHISSCCPPDAEFVSLSGTVGGGFWFLTGSLDIVITEDEIGVFISPRIERPGTAPGEEDYAFVTPQFGGSLIYGNLWGESLHRSVQEYEGPFGYIGGSLGPWTAEAFSSQNEYGVPDWNVTGVGSGFTGGPVQVPAEFHVNYTSSTYWPGPSSVLTTIKSWIESLGQ